MKFIRLKAIAWKELIQVVRDPRSLALAVSMPVILLVLFGYALTLDVDRIPTVLYDLDGTRNPDINAIAGTWASSVVGLGYTDQGIATDIRNGVKDCVDAFIKAYLSVNPKREDKTDKKPQD